MTLILLHRQTDVRTQVRSKCSVRNPGAVQLCKHLLWNPVVSQPASPIAIVFELGLRHDEARRPQERPVFVLYHDLQQSITRHVNTVS